MIESAQDIGYVMRWDKLDEKKAIQTQLFVELSKQEQNIVDFQNGIPFFFFGSSILLCYCCIGVALCEC